MKFRMLLFRFCFLLFMFGTSFFVFSKPVEEFCPFCNRCISEELIKGSINPSAYRFVHKGGDGEIYKLVHSVQGIDYPFLKVLDKELNRGVVWKEASALLSINHPNVIKVGFCYEDDAIFAFGLKEYHGDLFGYLLDRKQVDEEVNKKILRNILQALDYFHRHGVIHFDCKDENILLTESNDAVLADLGRGGWYKCFHCRDRMRQLMKNGPVCQVEYYMDPRARAGHTFGMEVDMWSVGVAILLLFEIRLDQGRLFDLIGEHLIEELRKSNPVQLSQWFEEHNFDYVRKCLGRNGLDQLEKEIKRAGLKGYDTLELLCAFAKYDLGIVYRFVQDHPKVQASTFLRENKILFETLNPDPKKIPKPGELLEEVFNDVVVHEQTVHSLGHNYF